MKFIRTIKLTIMLFCFLLLFPVLGRAELVEVDLLTAGDKKITLDTITGLEWLDVNETIGLSFNQALTTQFVTDLDFRHATISEFNVLCTNAGVHGPPEADFDEANLLMNLLGCGARCGGVHPFTQGWLEHEPPLEDIYFGEIAVNFLERKGFCQRPDIGHGRDSPRVITGNYLVRKHQINVSIDIKPDSFPNSINPKSHGVIPVAILSKPDFNAPIIVNTTSLTFGRTGDEQSLAFCGEESDDENESEDLNDDESDDKDESEDVNDDGLPDLICHFTTQLAGFHSGDMEGVLKGRTVTSTPIVGKDSVRILKNNGKHKNNGNYRVD